MAGYIFSLILIFQLSLYGTVYDDLPKNAELAGLTSVEFKVNGQKGKGEIFYSKYDKKNTMEAYRSLMKEKDFTQTGGNNGMLSFSKSNFKSTARFLEEKGGTTVVAFLTGETEEKAGPGDVSGVDLDSVPRPLGSKREFCMERLSGNERSVTLVYLIAESASSCESYFKTAMPGKGWIQVICRKTEQGIILAFEKNKSWCNITISGKTVIVSYYTK